MKEPTDEEAGDADSQIEAKFGRSVVEQARSAARRAAERELRNISDPEIEAVTASIADDLAGSEKIIEFTDRSKPRPRSRALPKPWGFALAAGVCGIVIGHFASFRPQVNESSDTDLVMSIGEISRDADRTRWTTRVPDPSVAISQLVTSLIQAHLAFEIFSNARTKERRVVFVVPADIPPELQAALDAVGAPKGVSGVAECTFQPR